MLFRSNGTLNYTPGQSNLYITVLSNAVIASGARLDASRAGYPSGTGPGVGQSGNYAGGGSHGGMGGTGYYGLLGGATTYGSMLQPTDCGSAGGNYGGINAGGAGGGTVRLIVNGTLTVDGAVIKAGTLTSTTARPTTKSTTICSFAAD